MATAAEIREKLEEMAKAHGPAVSNIARVRSVDEVNATCILEDEDGQEIFDVRLRAVLTGKKSFLQVPKVGSQVLAIRIEDDDDWMVIACDELEKVVWTVGQTTLSLTDKIKLEAGGESLATLIDDLFVAIDKMVFTTNMGPTIKLVNKPEFDSIKNRFKTLLR